MDHCSFANTTSNLKILIRVIDNQDCVLALFLFTLISNTQNYPKRSSRELKSPLSVNLRKQTNQKIRPQITPQKVKLEEAIVIETHQKKHLQLQPQRVKLDQAIMKKCRICLKANGSLRLSNQFAGSRSRHTIGQVVLDTLGMDVRDKNFPQSICRDCYSSLINAHSLKTQILCTDIILKGRLKGVQRLNEQQRAPEEAFALKEVPLPGADSFNENVVFFISEVGSEGVKQELKMEVENDELGDVLEIVKETETIAVDETVEKKKGS